MLRTDDGHRWEQTLYMPMSSSYARTLYDDGAMLMTGETRPADLGVKSGDVVYIRPLAERPALPSRPVDIDTDFGQDTHGMPLELLTERLQPGSVVQRAAPSLPAGRCFGESCRQGRALCTEQCAEIEAARMAGAGMQEPSEPMPLAWTGARIGNMLGSIVGFGIFADFAFGAWGVIASWVAR